MTDVTTKTSESLVADKIEIIESLTAIKSDESVLIDVKLKTSETLVGIAKN